MFPGVIKYVSTHNKLAPDVVRDKDIVQLQHLVSDRKVSSVVGFDFKAGDKVRIISGLLQGFEGYLIRKKASTRLVIRVDAINRYVAVELYPQDVIKVLHD